jgi:Ras family protein T1
VATKSELDLAQQRHEVQPDVYCRRLGLQVPVAVSVKTSQMADLFNAICDIAIHPYVIRDSVFLHYKAECIPLRSTAIPGGADRALSTAGRVRVYFTMSALVGGFAAGLLLMYRSLFRPSGNGGGMLGNTQAGLWLGWLLGRREL